MPDWARASSLRSKSPMMVPSVSERVARLMLLSGASASSRLTPKGRRSFPCNCRSRDCRRRPATRRKMEFPTRSPRCPTCGRKVRPTHRCNLRSQRCSRSYRSRSWPSAHRRHPLTCRNLAMRKHTLGYCRSRFPRWAGLGTEFADRTAVRPSCARPCPGRSRNERQSSGSGVAGRDSWCQYRPPNC